MPSFVIMSVSDTHLRAGAANRTRLCFFKRTVNPLESMNRNAPALT